MTEAGTCCTWRKVSDTQQPNTDRETAVSNRWWMQTKSCSVNTIWHCKY